MATENEPEVLLYEMEAHMNEVISGRTRPIGMSTVKNLMWFDLGDYFT